MSLFFVVLLLKLASDFLNQFFISFPSFQMRSKYTRNYQMLPVESVSSLASFCVTRLELQIFINL